MATELNSCSGKALILRGRGGLVLEQFSFRQQQPGRHVEVQGRQLSLRWHVDGDGVQLDSLALAQLAVDWQTVPAVADQTANPVSLAGVTLPETAPFWLPQQLDIAAVSVAFPCGTGRCELQGALALQQQPAPLPQAVSPQSWQLSLNAGLLFGGKPYPFNIQSRIALLQNNPWQLQLDATSINASLPQLALADLHIQDLTAVLALTGQMSAKALALDFGAGSVLQLEQLDGPVALQGLQVDLDRIQVSAAFDAAHPTLGDALLKGPLTVSARQVLHTALRPQPWRFQGETSSSLAQLNLSGKLSAGAGVTVQVSLGYPVGGTLHASGQWQGSGETASAALAATLVDWPLLLTFDSGKVSASLDLRLPVTGEPQLNGQLKCDKLSGTYDRMTWTGLTGTAVIGLRQSLLHLQVPELALDQLNPGVPFGPIAAAGHYQAALDQLGAGTLDLQQATAGFLGGEVRAEPAKLALGSPPAQLQLHLGGLQLAQLMALYPAEGLAGSGVLNGQLPLLIGPGGIQVHQGKVAALSPGGTLSIPLQRLGGMAQGNAAMQLVAGALENFHYSVLASTLDYDQDGTLLLGLHLEGRNPDVGSGQPFNFNISLEEDVPALLTSLQLSGRVSAAVTERVRTRLDGEATDNATSTGSN